MSKMLSQLGVNKALLSPEEREFLDQNGYVSLGQILSEEDVDQINAAIDVILAREGENAGFELVDSKYIRHPRETGVDRVADLVNKGEIFDIFYTQPRVLAAISQVLGPEIKLSSLNYRAAHKGFGNQKLHADWHETVAPGDYKVCNSIWLLDDFVPENGPTRIVPGTHKSGSLPQDVLDDPTLPHPDQKLILEPAGTVVIFNSHAWHGGTTNLTEHPRRAIHSYFCRRDQPQQIDQKRYLIEETKRRLRPAALAILGV